MMADTGINSCACKLLKLASTYVQLDAVQLAGE